MCRFSILSFFLKFSFLENFESFTKLEIPIYDFPKMHLLSLMKFWQNEYNINIIFQLYY